MRLKSLKILFPCFLGFKACSSRNRVKTGSVVANEVTMMVQPNLGSIHTSVIYQDRRYYVHFHLYSKLPVDLPFHTRAYVRIDLTFLVTSIISILCTSIVPMDTNK